MRTMDDERADIAYFRSKVRTHEFRKWTPPLGESIPENKVNICGDCGGDRSDHPSYWLNVSSEADQKRLARLMMTL